MSEFRLPALGADMEFGTIVEWLVEPGARISRGDVIAVVETQKGAIEIEVFEDGVVTELRVPVGEKVPVGTVLAVIGGAEAAPQSKAPKAPSPPSRPPPAPKPAHVSEPRPAKAGQVRASPVARRRAEALGVDLVGIDGTGPDGAVTLADVDRAAVAKSREEPAAQATPRRVGFDRDAMRQAIGSAMTRSKRDIPHYYLGRTIDMGPSVAWLRAANEARPVADRLLYGVLLLKATALALRQVPELNGFWIDGRAEPSERIHVGWAIALRGGGLMAPAIHDADAKTLDELMAALRDLVTRTRTARIRGSEMTDPTVTVTSLGERGAQQVYGVIYPPQLAIVGFGALGPTPIVVGDRVDARPAVFASLAADHRASDGQTGGRLLAAIDAQLQKPETL